MDLSDLLHYRLNAKLLQTSITIRFNSGVRDRHIFFVSDFFLFRKIGTNSLMLSYQHLFPRVKFLQTMPLYVRLKNYVHQVFMR